MRTFFGKCCAPVTRPLTLRNTAQFQPGHCKCVVNCQRIHWTPDCNSVPEKDIRDAVPLESPQSLCVFLPLIDVCVAQGWHRILPQEKEIHVTTLSQSDSDIHQVCVSFHLSWGFLFLPLVRWLSWAPLCNFRCAEELGLSCFTTRPEALHTQAAVERSSCTRNKCRSRLVWPLAQSLNDFPVA